ncbi:MAG: 3-phosphoserine/phosphohydroxythreonine transaminase [Pseudomonadales bacterium]|nr:3-phosphoserine/phosphohydroxythreonine transaminase [Pseudomonadales bacterium]MCP5215628.1 3-phosphoserine/phosphohydroxythreonine transaminase [Pseudomonadales bacterium]
MSSRVFNFSAGPAMLPTEVMEKAQQEFLDYRGMGASVIEISHRCKEFDQIVDRCDELIRELSGLPSNYKMLYVHGGARMQFSAIPMNLLPLSASRKAVYFETGNFAKLARKEAEKFGNIKIAATSEATNFDRIPKVSVADVDQDAAYAHMTSNNTIYGTRWQEFPDTGVVPLVADMTSEIFSRVIDYSQFGAVYAGFQKNLGPSGVALVMMREDLIGKATPDTPTLLDYKVYMDNHSMANTINTFAMYMLMLMLEWKKEQGGIAALEKINQQKAKTLYELIDASDFYLGSAQPESRSVMTVTFNLANNDLAGQFLAEALKNGLYALKGHRAVGGIRASIYNAMPLAGVQALADFMKEFERVNG